MPEPSPSPQPTPLKLKLPENRNSQKIITIRISADFHAVLKQAAHKLETSMNMMCINALENQLVIDGVLNDDGTPIKCFPLYIHPVQGFADAAK